MYLNLRQILRILCLSGIGASYECVGAQVVHYRLPSSPADQYENYTIELLKLALDKTRLSYGDYELQPLPAGVTRLRARKAVASNEYPDLVIEDSYAGVPIPDVTYIAFPVDLGMLSYRVCFVNPQVAQLVAVVETSDELKRYRILQGINWVDTQVLNSNGFNTFEMFAYKSSFRMVASGRADLFCLGASQVMNEYLQNNSSLRLSIDESFYFYYKLPRFFFLNRQSKKLKRRIEQGLLIAYHDKSLQSLWEEKFLPSLIFIKLEKRKRFEINNSINDELDTGYEQYFLPLSGVFELVTSSPKTHLKK
ncbi:hypothetical protein ACSV5M_18935 [Cellvibrio sp. ARAG 10.3]|uniref:hypothetical protein n=1 Tax=Cellvibrio sp. ARAG 10.3 TaxID=3451358 RepID=UPI003F46191A